MCVQECGIGALWNAEKSALFLLKIAISKFENHRFSHFSSASAKPRRSRWDLSSWAVSYPGGSCVRAGVRNRRDFELVRQPRHLEALFRAPCPQVFEALLLLG